MNTQLLIDAVVRQTTILIAKLDASIARLLESRRIVVADGSGEPKYRAPSLVLPLGTSQGWEAAIFDHFQAVVNTICHKLRHDPGGAAKDDRVGGSTYSLEVRLLGNDTPHRESPRRRRAHRG